MDSGRSTASSSTTSFADLKSVARYFVVGGIATVVDVGLFLLFAQQMGLPYLRVAAGTFVLATYQVRTHTVITEIQYSATHFSVAYHDSVNMKHGPGPDGGGGNQRVKRAPVPSGLLRQWASVFQWAPRVVDEKSSRGGSCSTGAGSNCGAGTSLRGALSPWARRGQPSAVHSMRCSAVSRPRLQCNPS